MAHVCQVEDLEEDCVKHLSQNTKIDPIAGDVPDVNIDLNQALDNSLVGSIPLTTRTNP